MAAIVPRNSHATYPTAVGGEGFCLIDQIGDRRGKTAAMEDGLMCYPRGGTIDGQSGDQVLLAPLAIIEEDQIDVLSRAIETVVAA